MAHEIRRLAGTADYLGLLNNQKRIGPEMNSRLREQFPKADIDFLLKYLTTIQAGPGRGIEKQ